MAKRPLVIITETLDDACAQWLCQRADVRRVRHDSADFAGALAHAEGLVVRTYTQVNPALLAQAPKLKVVGRAGVGLDNIDVPACRARGVEVVYTPDANTQAVVEYVIALMLDVLRPRPRLSSAPSPEQFHELRQQAVGPQLERLTLGILGFGRIGKRLGKVASALGMKVLAHDLLPAAQLRALVDYPVELVDLSTLAQASDIFTIHIDGRASNRGFVNAQVLSQLKPPRLLINAARGMLVDNAALRAWAQAHPDCTIALDVHEPEPIPADYPLLGLSNVQLLPHLASRTHEALENMSWVVRDVWAVLAGETPTYPAEG